MLQCVTLMIWISLIRHSAKGESQKKCYNASLFYIYLSYVTLLRVKAKKNMLQCVTFTCISLIRHSAKGASKKKQNAKCVTLIYISLIRYSSKGESQKVTVVRCIGDPYGYVIMLRLWAFKRIMWCQCDSSHWKCYIPEIHQNKILRLLDISWYKFKLTFCLTLTSETWICRIQVSRSGEFLSRRWGCSNFSGICHSIMCPFAQGERQRVVRCIRRSVRLCCYITIMNENPRTRDSENPCIGIWYSNYHYYDPQANVLCWTWKPESRASEIFREIRTTIVIYY